MKTLNDKHHRFASLFTNEIIQPYAYLLSKNLEDGNICIELSSLKDNLNIDFPFIDFEPDLVKLIDQTELVTIDPVQKKPFVISNDKLYLQRFYFYEDEIYRKIIRLIETESKDKIQRQIELYKHKNFVEELFQSNDDTSQLSEEEKTDWQRIAALTTVLSNFSIITGGPGTGKTTTVAKILSILFELNSNEKVALAAQTGKAAMRMAESIRNADIQVKDETKMKLKSLEPFTIHRLLKTKLHSPYFKHNESNPVQYDTVIVDESSMIDVALFYKLLSAIGDKTRLILLGDRNQLASVEAGSIFGDLCQTGFKINSCHPETAEFVNKFISETEKKIKDDFIDGSIRHPLVHHITELKRSRRFDSNKGIGKLSKSILNQTKDDLKNYLNKEDAQIEIDLAYSDAVFEETIEMYEAYIKETNIAIALKKLNELRVLCAVRESEQGIYFINSRIEKLLQNKKLLTIQNDFYHNRPIIVTSNNKELGLFNGDIGIIRIENNQAYAWFEDGNASVRKFLPALIGNFETVFAMTIHKSQGSEYDNVLIILPKKEQNSLLTKELLYTAVTRAKKKVIIQSALSTIENTVLASVKRASGISERFNSK